MKYALFLGCTIPARLIQYELSARAVLEKLKVELIDIKEFNCCGYPLGNTDFKASILAASRNLGFMNFPSALSSESWFTNTVAESSKTGNSRGSYLAAHQLLS